MTRWAVVPAKDFARAKSRLSGVLDAAARAALAERMLGAVLDALHAGHALDGVLVATDGDAAARVAEARGARVLRDAPGAEAGLAAIVDRALAHAAHLGADEALVLMADLPLIGAADVGALLDALDGAELVVAPDAARRGTNALGLRLGAVSTSQLGHDDSFERHLAAGRDAGLSTQVLQRRGLAEDVDTPADLHRLLPRPTPSRAAS